MKQTAEIWEETELPRRLKLHGLDEQYAIIQEWHELSDFEDED